MDEFDMRDLFAGLAMCGMVANPIMEDASNDDIAFGSYRLADAMLRERTAKDEDGIAAINKRKK